MWRNAFTLLSSQDSQHKTLMSDGKLSFLLTKTDEFRHHEGDREHYFKEGEERRNAESQQHSDGIWHELEK